jgi:hypothetical protein
VNHRRRKFVVERIGASVVSKKSMWAAIRHGVYGEVKLDNLV